MRERLFDATVDAAQAFVSGALQQQPELQSQYVSPYVTPRSSASGPSSAPRSIDFGKYQWKETEKAPNQGIGEPVLFGQRRVDPNFSIDPRFPKTSGRPLADVANDLRVGEMNPNDIPLTAFRHPNTGSLISMNTRTRAALAEAGLEPTNVEIVDFATLSSRQKSKYLRRLNEPLVIDSPLPGRRVPVTPSMGDLRVMPRPDGSPYIIEIQD